MLLPSFETTRHIKNELDAYRFIIKYLNPNYNLIVSTGRWEETIGTFEGLDPSVGSTASHFDDIYTGASATYSVTVCDDRIDPDENPYCYEGDPANGILKNELDFLRLNLPLVLSVGFLLLDLLFGEVSHCLPLHL